MLDFSKQQPFLLCHFNYILNDNSCYCLRNLDLLKSSFVPRKIRPRKAAHAKTEKDSQIDSATLLLLVRRQKGSDRMRVVQLEDLNDFDAFHEGDRLAACLEALGSFNLMIEAEQSDV